MRRTSLVMMALATAVGISTPARGHGPEIGEKLTDLAALSQESNLVFVGQVADVKYRQAKIEGGEGTLPFTVVTYSIGEVMRGKSPGDTFAMRFPGGPDGRGGFVEVSGVPKFQPGDRDLLFVTGNGEKGCPLAECEWGRFRIHADAVYNTHGSPIKALGKSRALARGFPPDDLRRFRFPAPSFDDLMKNPAAAKILEAKKLKLEDARAQFAQEAPKEIEIRTVFPKSNPQGGPDLLAKQEDAGAATKAEGAADATADGASPKLAAEARASTMVLRQKELKLLEPELAKAKLTDATARELLFRDPSLKFEAKAIKVDRFLGEVRTTAKRFKAPAAELRSIDPKEEIVVKFTGALTPGKEAGAAAADAQSAKPSPQDETERKLLEAQGFDPVLEKKP